MIGRADTRADQCRRGNEHRAGLAPSLRARLDLDEKSFRLALNNDAMATDEYREGVSAFQARRPPNFPPLR